MRKSGRVQADHAKFWAKEVVSGLGILVASQIAEKGMNGACTVCAGDGP